MAKSEVYKNYGDYTLPFYGAIYNRNLKFPNSNVNSYNNYISLKNIIDPRLCKSNTFGKKNKYGNKYSNIWYPNMHIDNNYNPNIGGYLNANGPVGPYFALGLMNYPNSMYKELYFGKNKKIKNEKTQKSPKRKTKQSPKRKPKVIYCLPKEQKYPVNTKKKCSSALSYARYAKSPCKIARCVKKQCNKKYPTVGKTSELMKKCKIKI